MHCKCTVYKIQNHVCTMAQIRIVYNLIRPIARKSGRENQSIRLKKGGGGGGGGGANTRREGCYSAIRKAKGAA